MYKRQAGLPLIAAAGDKMCETLGSGVFSPKQATVSYGTMATIGTTITRYVEDSKLKFYTFASCIPDAWNPEYNIYRGYWLITWFCNQYSKEQGMPEFLNEMNELAADVPPGSNGLLDVYKRQVRDSRVLLFAKRFRTDLTTSIN